MSIFEVPKRLDDEIEMYYRKYQLAGKERGAIHALNWDKSSDYCDEILEYVESFTDGVIGAISHMKSKSEYPSVKDKL